ncbi:transposase [Myxococcus stipitatus]|uniref:transposase n=1 Tax=Myxococcus stipitatus TaxID=83455 RepID=UPI003CC8AA1C
MFSGLGRVERRRAMDWYVKGLLLEGERKSIEPMAGRLVEQPSEKETMRQRLQQCIGGSSWAAPTHRKASHQADQPRQRHHPIFSSYRGLNTRCPSKAPIQEQPHQTHLAETQTHHQTQKTPAQPLPQPPPFPFATQESENNKQPLRHFLLAESPFSDTDSPPQLK